MSPSRSSRRSTRWRPMKPGAPVTKWLMPGLRSPAAAPVGVGGAALGGVHLGVLALVQAPLDDREDNDHDREEGDHDEHRVGDHVVAGLPDAALAAAVVAGALSQRR